MSVKTPATSKPTSSRRRRRGCLLLIVLGLASILVATVFLYRSCNPYDEVVITVADIPAGTTHVCIVGDNGKGPFTLPVYDRHICGSAVGHPEKAWFFKTRIVGDDQKHVQGYGWSENNRLGVLYKARDGQWIIVWFNPPKIRIEGRTWLKGGGHWTVSLNDADEIQQITDDTLRAMGFVKALMKPEPAVPKKQ